MLTMAVMPLGTKMMGGALLRALPDLLLLLLRPALASAAATGLDALAAALSAAPVQHAMWCSSTYC